MIFTVSSQILLKELQLLNGVISTNTVLPILEDFLLQLNENSLRIFASDLETSMSSVLQVEGTENGEVAIPSRILLDTLKALPEQPLHFEINNDSHTVTLTSANGTYHLAGESGDDFPNIPDPGEVSEVTMDGDILQRAIAKTLFAVSTDELRLAMTGVNVELSETGATFVATDAHKLVKYINKNIISDEYRSFIIPRKALSLLKTSLALQPAKVHISYNNANAFFNIDTIELICRLVDAKYPDYSAVIPTNNPNVLTIDRGDLEKALKRIAIYASKTNYQVKLALTENLLKLSAEDRDFSNEAQEKLPCHYNGDPMEIAFNARFLAEVMNVLDSDQVSINLSTPSRAGVVIPSEMKDGEDLLMLVMPIMISQMV